MPRAFTDSERRGIRDRLIEVGKRLINTAGLRLLVIEDIAREAGISKGSFYSFFPSREDFILSVFEAWEGERREELFRAISEGEGTRAERLERFFLGTFRLIEREPGLAKLSFRDIEGLMQGLPAERLAAHQARDKEALNRSFAEWAKGGLIDPSALSALPGIVSAIFIMALHREDFRQGGYEAATRLISEAISQRLAKGPKGGEEK